MIELELMRKKIDEIDDKLLALFKERLEVSKKIGSNFPRSCVCFLGETFREDTDGGFGFGGLDAVRRNQIKADRRQRPFGQNGFQTALGDFFPNFAAHLQRQTETAFGQAAHGGKMRAGNAVGNIEEIAFATVL